MNGYLNEQDKKITAPVINRRAAIFTFWSYCLLSLTKNAVNLCATNWADSLSHTAARIRDLYMSFKGALLFALNAVSLAFVLFCHFDPPSAVRSLTAGSSCMSVRMSPPYPPKVATKGFSTHKSINIQPKSLKITRKLRIFTKSMAHGRRFNLENSWVS
jgi:hypothetical protein